MRDLVEALEGLERDSALGDDPVEMEEFRVGAAEVLPHVRRDPLALAKRCLGVGGGQIVEHALLPMQVRRDQPPRRSRAARRRLERQRQNRQFEQPEYGVFQPVTQVFEIDHHSARPVGSPAESA